MSVRTLFSTTVASTEKLVTGVVSLGSPVGDCIEYLKRQASQLNSERAIELETASRELSYSEQEAQLIERAATIDIVKVKEEFKELKEILGMK